MERRTFLRTSAFAATAFATRGVFAKTNANDKIGIALIGARRMGWGDLASAMTTGEAECVAIADVDTDILQAKGAEAEKLFGKKPILYSDYRKVLENKDVDAVIIGTPDHWHCLIFCDACAAGKDVYVEKPIANSMAECDIMVKFAKKYNRVAAVGQQQDSSQMWDKVIGIARSGALGKIARTDVWANFKYGAGAARVPDEPVPANIDYNMWVGPAPMSPYNKNRFHGLWRVHWNYGGGLMTDWGVHLLDMAVKGIGKTDFPNKVTALGGRFLYPQNDSQTFDTLNVNYDFGDSSISWSNVSTLNYAPYNMNYGVAFIGERGVLAANREGWELFPNTETKCIDAPEPQKGKPTNNEHLAHLKNFIQCIRSRKTETACSIENGAFCAKLAHMGNISARVGKTLSYDDNAKTFADAAADALIKPKYRAPWKFPTI